MKPKKILYYLYLFFLISGACLTLGFLSFTGAIGVWPAVGFGALFFGLSVLFEGEIYLQNIRGAFNKLYKRNYQKQEIAKRILKAEPAIKNKNNFASNPDLLHEEFILQYAELSKMQKEHEEYKTSLEKTLHQNFFKSKDQKADKKRELQAAQKISISLEKSLKEARLLFADTLFVDQSEFSQYFVSLEKRKEEYRSVFIRNKKYEYYAKIFCATSAVFATLGTAFLLTSALLTFSFFAAMPLPMLSALIITASVISGIAQAKLTYNSLMDMINKGTLQEWYEKIRDTHDWSSKLIALTAVSLGILGLILTVCTAFTWRTIVLETSAVFSWMKRIPVFLNTVIMPVFQGLMALIFNIENCADSVKELEKIIANLGKKFSSIGQKAKNTFLQFWCLNTLIQFNPFLFIIKLLYTPVLIVLFLGHLLSIAFTSDRVPGLSRFFSTVLNFILEGCTDINYADGVIPNSVLKIMFSPLFAASILWRFAISGTYTWENFQECWSEGGYNKNVSLEEEKKPEPIKGSRTLELRLAAHYVQRKAPDNIKLQKILAENFQQQSAQEKTKSLQEILSETSDASDQRFFKKLQRYVYTTPEPSVNNGVSR